MSTKEQSRPRIALTMGDVCGVGPEVVATAVSDTDVLQLCDPLVVGDPKLLTDALELISSDLKIRELKQCPRPTEQLESGCVSCWNPSIADLKAVPLKQISSQAGQAAYDWLCAATDVALQHQIDAIVTAPLNKAALHAAGHHYPGHTEILAERCGIEDFAMMLYLPPGEIVKSPFGFGVAHVTLHTSIASVPGLLSTDSIFEKIGLMHRFLKRIGCDSPRVGVCALNPHGGEQGLFGDEEQTLIAPAVQQAVGLGIDASGPFPADTLLKTAVEGAFDGVVAMYHDQGHIALKLIGFNNAVNVTLGLPIVRTSPSHGTAFDIAWQGQADGSGMIEAIRVAVALVNTRNNN